MAFVPIPLCIQLRVQAELSGEPIENTFHALAVEAPYTAAGATALATAVRDAWQASMMPPLSTAYLALQVRALGQASASDFSVTVPFTGGPTGSNATGPLPANNAYVITHRTANRGRSFRGRTYVAGLVEGETSGNFVTQAWANAVLGGLNAVRTAITTAGYVMVVASRYANNAPRVQGITTAITGFNLRNLRVDSQRGRNQD